MIKSLILTDFRNHKNSKINTAGHKNIIITGPNGSGKTAILEALSMLSGDRGMRGAQMSDIARFDGLGGFSIFANLSDDTQISVFYNKDDSNRHTKIDGDNSSLSELSSHLRMVWLTPREDRLFLESVSDRRSFFDRMVSNFNSSHNGRTARLSKLLSERGYAIKMNADNNWLVSIEKQIASTAVSVAAARIQYISELNYFLTNCTVSLNGKIESEILNSDASTAESDYINYLSKNRELIGDKMVIDGAHKTDFLVFNNILKLPAGLTSTGQQKTVLIDLIIAHAKLINTKTNKTPLILLDEAVAHLDKTACNNMFAELAGANAQVWATGTDVEKFANLEDVEFVTCNNLII